MITVRSGYGCVTRWIEASGHANAPRSEDGRDLVCCAVSTLMCALANSLAKLDALMTTYDHSSGYARVAVTGRDARSIAVEARMAVVMDGLEALAKQYPQSIDINP